MEAKKNNAISLSAEIVPGQSIGGILIGENVLDIIDRLPSDQELICKEFNNFGKNYYLYSINNGIINFTSDKDDVVLAIWCGVGYKGKCDEKYYPGISVGEVKENFRKIEIYHGYLVLDDNYKIYYELPEEFDDFNDFNEVDDDVILRCLYVGDLKK